MSEADNKKYTILGIVRSQSGFSLSELLMTLVLIGLITLAVAGGIGMIARSYTKVVDRADAEQLLSTTVSRITDELSFARNYATESMSIKISNSNKQVDFVSGLTGLHVRISTDGDSMHMYYYSGSEPKPSEEIPLLDDHLKERMSINFGEIAYNPTEGLFTINNISVKYKGKNEIPVKIQEYSVARINSQTQN